MNRQNDQVVSLQEWLITFLILMIPLVNLIMMFVWAFSSSTKASKANFFKAYLCIMGVFFLLGILFALFFGSMLRYQ